MASITLILRHACRLAYQCRHHQRVALFTPRAESAYARASFPAAPQSAFVAYAAMPPYALFRYSRTCHLIGRWVMMTARYSASAAKDDGFASMDASH